MHRLAKHVGTILITVCLGGLLGATLVRYAPGYGVDEEELDARLSSGSIHALRRANVPDENVFLFYGRFLQRMVRGDLGTSRTLRRPVAQLLRERGPDTLKSVGLGVLLGWILGLALAIPVAMSRAWLVDTFASLIAGILLCIPVAVLALLFVLTRAPSRVVIALIIFPKVFRYARNLLTRSAGLPHVLTARAKGLGHVRVFLWHVLPTAGPQLFALAGVSVSLAFGASIPVEVLCDLPGIGQLAWKAALGRDLYLLINLTMIVTVVTMMANSAGDLLGHALRRSEA
ncbi:MAG TPA: ABC transporter permease [Terriglobales bacterium]|nr:ABC transporter permease [Terriglobales bacterium]